MNGPFAKVNDRLIPGAGSSPIPHEYTFVDKDVKEGNRYFYYLQDVDIHGSKSCSEIIEVFIEITAPDNLPREFALLQNFPNPSNPGTSIPYQLASASSVTISIYDTRGRLMRTIESGKQNEGLHVTYWDGRDGSGKRVASGVYFYMLQVGRFKATRKMVIMK